MIALSFHLHISKSILISFSNAISESNTKKSLNRIRDLQGGNKANCKKEPDEESEEYKPANKLAKHIAAKLDSVLVKYPSKK